MRRWATRMTSKYGTALLFMTQRPEDGHTPGLGNVVYEVLWVEEGDQYCLDL